jgi:hypothetical protein
MSQRKFIDEYWFCERRDIKLEHIRNPTPKQIHDAENEALEEFEDLYGKFDLERWPRQRE